MLTILFSLFLSPCAQAESGFIKIPAGHELYFDYQKAEAGKPTFVLVNGLVYQLNRWEKLSQPLQKSGYGVLRYYFRGQLATLRQELKSGRPAFFASGLSGETFALELSQLMDALKIEKGIVVGLSYGSSIAAEFARLYPKKVEQLVFLAPLVIPLDRYDAGGAWIHWNLQALRLSWGPLFGPYVYDYYYNWIYRSYMGQRLVPEKIPDEMKDVSEDYKESVFHQVRATRDFDLRAYTFPGLEGRVHLFLASEEEAPALKDQFRAWKAFGKSRASLVYFSPSWHAIPDSCGRFAAELLNGVAKEEARFAPGKIYYAGTKDKSLEPVASADALEQRALAEPRGEKE